MSFTIIEDGSGSGNKVKVDSKNRLHTDSVSRTQSQQAIVDGLGFNVNTGAITLTTDGMSGVGYFKYTGDNRLIVKEILVILGDSTGGSGLGTIEVIKNPTTGTLISNAVAVETAVNRDFSSANLLDGLAYKGAEGDTITDGSIFASTSRSSFTDPIRFDADIIVLGKGNSIAVRYTPPTGNTNQIIRIAGTLFEEVTA